MADPKVSIGIGVNSQNLFSDLQKASIPFKQFGKDIENQMGGLSKVIGNLKAPFLAVGAAIGSLAVLKKAADDTVSYVKDTNKLANVLGISSEKASVLKLAIGDIYGNDDEFLALTGKITKSLNGNEEAFKKLGVQTRDGQGNFRNTTDIILETNTALGKIEKGTDRNIAGLQVYGKGWMDAQKYIKLTNDVMSEAEEKAKRLNLVIGPEHQERVAAFRAAENDMEDVMTGLKLSLGMEVLPALTSFGVWLSEVGPGLIKVFSVALKGLVTGFYTLGFIIKTIANVAYSVVETVMIIFEKPMDIIQKMLSGDFKGALASVKGAGKEIQESWSNAFSIIGENWDKLGEKLGNTWDGGPVKATKSEGQKNPFSDNKDSESKLAGIEAAFEKQKRDWTELGIVGQEQLQKQIEWLKNSALAVGLSEKDKQKLIKQSYDVQNKLDEEKYKKEIATLDKQIVALKGNYDGQIQLAKDRADRIGKQYGLDSDKYEEAQKKIVELENKKNEELKKVEEIRNTSSRNLALSRIQMEEADLQDQKARNLISTDAFLVAQQEFEDRRYQISYEALQDRLDLNNLELSEREQILADMKALEAGYKLRQADLERQKNNAGSNDSEGGFFAGLNSVLDSGRDKFSQYKNIATGVASSIQASFSNAFAGILKGTMSLSQGVKSLWQGMKDIALKSIVEIMAKKAQEWVLDKAISIWRSINNKKTVAENTSEQASNTGTAASGIMKAHASIPYVGVAIAIGMIALMLATLSQFTARAKGGLVDRPELMLAGEAGPEVVAPRATFIDWTRDIQAETAANLIRLTSSVSQPNTNSGSQGVGGLASSRVEHHHHYNVSGNYFVGDSAEGLDRAARKIAELNTYHQQTYGY